MFSVRPVRLPDDLKLVGRLLREYAADLRVAQCSEDFEAELADLASSYTGPGSELLVVVGRDDCPIGCVAIRRLADTVAEMKRLYLAPEGRGAGLGKQLVVAAIEAARRLGYCSIRLDTLPGQTAAQGIYRSLGFVAIGPYRHNPVEGTRYLELSLSSQ